MGKPITQFSTFDRLSKRYRIQGLMLTQTGLRVGAGKSFDVGTTDSPVMRDAFDRLFIPGSSLKGVLRSGLESVLRGLDHPSLRACDLFDDPCTKKLEEKRKKQQEVGIEEVLETVCAVCGLFGSPFVAGRVFVADLPLDGGDSRSEVRDGVGIDRDRGVARTFPAIKFDHEVVPPGTRFRLEMILENLDDDIQLGLVIKALELLDRGEVRLGGLTSRGLGRVSLRELRLERTDARRLLEGQDYQALDYSKIKAKTEKQLVRQLWPEQEA